MEWNLEGRISDPDLLFSLIHELGQTFYIKINRFYEAVYFTGSKAVYFKGELSEEQVKKLEMIGHKVKFLKIDEGSRTVRIEQ